MASFRKKKGGWNVQVRRSGYPNLSKTFTIKTDAQAWARGAELRLERDELFIFTKPDLSTLGDTLSRYIRDITSKNQCWCISLWGLEYPQQKTHPLIISQKSASHS